MSAIFIGRGDKIRTCDPSVPNRVRYQTAPLPGNPETPFQGFSARGAPAKPAAPAALPNIIARTTGTIVAKRRAFG